jgi:hypothetical protein
MITSNRELYVEGVISPIDEDHLMEVLAEMNVGEHKSTGGSERIVQFVVPASKSRKFLAAMKSGLLKEKDIAQKLTIYP